MLFVVAGECGRHQLKNGEGESRIWQWVWILLDWKTLCWWIQPASLRFFCAHCNRPLKPSSSTKAPKGDLVRVALTRAVKKASACSDTGHGDKYAPCQGRRGEHSTNLIFCSWHHWQPLGIRKAGQWQWWLCNSRWVPCLQVICCGRSCTPPATRSKVSKGPQSCHRG
jgi:hypothetical protein